MIPVEWSALAGDGVGVPGWTAGGGSTDPAGVPVLRPPCDCGLSRDNQPLTHSFSGAYPPLIRRVAHAGAVRHRARGGPGVSVGVDELPDGGDLAAQLVVAGRFAGDL